MFIPFFRKKLKQSDFTHVVITHFNLDYATFYPQVPVGQYKNIDWLKKRFELFENYCLKTMIKQTNKNFIWLCFFHKDTPEPFMSKILKYKDLCPQIKIYFGDTFEKYCNSLAEIVKECIEPRKYLVTTRLDGDDCFSVDYIENIQQNIYETKKGYFLDFIYGYIYDEIKDEVHYQKFRRNPFCSRVERWEDLKTVRMIGHDRINQAGPIYMIKTKPMWAQIIHGGNILNFVDGPIQKDLSDFKTRFLIN